MSTPIAKPNPENDDKGMASGLYVTVKGRIESFKKITPESGNDFVQTLIIIPSKDAYSHPGTFAVNSDARLGADGSEVSVYCELRPSVRRKNGEKYHNINLWVAN